MEIEKPSWVDNGFLEIVLQLAETDNTIEVISYDLKPATSKGDNFMSDMIKVIIKYTRKEGNESVMDEKSIIFKSEPANNDQEMKAMQIYMFHTEIRMMTESLEKMSAILGYRLCAHAFYARLERPLCIIMEDLTTQGFQMPNRTVGLDLAHCMLAIQTMAKFHASSVALCEKEPKYKSAYCRGLFHEDQPKGLQDFITNASRSLAAEVEKWPELGKRCADKIANFVPKLYEIGIEATRRDDNELNVINHGDCWINNMMYRYDENSKPVEHIFVDFQACNYTSPTVDLHHFLSTSPNEEVQLNNTDDLCKEYYRILTNTMGKIGCKTRPPTKREFSQSFMEREIYGMIVAMSLLPLILLENCNAVTNEEVRHGAENPGVKNPVYKRIMLKKLQQYDEIGLLDW